MHFGRVDSFAGIDLSLPADQKRTKGFLGLEWEQAGFIRTGAPIWACPGWVDKVYPKGARPKDYLFHYSRKFSCVELNASFYSTPTKQQIQAWLDMVPENFRFCPKMSQLISAQLRQRAYHSELTSFLHMLESFGSYGGLPFAQLPEHFSVEYLDDFILLLQSLPKELNVAFEFRHPSWFSVHMLKDKIIDLLYRFGKSTVISDTPGRRDALHLSLTQPMVLIRFLAYFNSGKDEARLRNWIKKLDGWQQRGVQIYFFVHEPNNNVIPDILENLSWRLKPLS